MAKQEQAVHGTADVSATGSSLPTARELVLCRMPTLHTSMTKRQPGEHQSRADRALVRDDPELGLQ